MIKLSSITKIYPTPLVALRDINLHIKSGEFVSIIGQSASGKTTLAKLLIAEEKATKGSIEIGGNDVTFLNSGDIPYLRRQIGTIFQDYKLLSRKTVHENVSFALEVAGKPKKRIRKIVDEVLEIVGLGQKHKSYPRELSGGEQQRVAIARSLVHGPKIMIADEPTGNLDTINTEDIIDILKKINEYGTTVLMFTHNREIVNRLKKRVITLDKGKIIMDVEQGKYVL
jgi:cell division transport system ATP-binding protein